MVISLTQAKPLCTAAELELVRASLGKSINKLSSTELQRNIARARTLRDKWLDQSRNQHRAKQASAKSRGAAKTDTRSAEKAELFAEVLTRFESQLTKITPADRSPGPALKRLSPRARSAKHRNERAEIREELKEDRLILSAPKQPTTSKAKKPAAVPPVSAPIDEEPAEILPIPRKRSKKPPMAAASLGKGKITHAGAGLTALQSGREIQGLRVTKAKQLRASTAAKKSRLQASEIMRVKGNAAANTRRRQAKRDSR